MIQAEAVERFLCSFDAVFKYLNYELFVVFSDNCFYTHDVQPSSKQLAAFIHPHFIPKDKHRGSHAS